MIELTDRGKAFRSAIAAFIEARREAKLKGKEDDADVASKYDYTAWLADAARRVSQIQAVTHVLKATHPDARGSSLHVPPDSLRQRTEIGSHELASDYAEDVVGNAAAADVYAFLRLKVEGKRLLDWMQEADSDLQAALSNDAGVASDWTQAFTSLARNKSKPTSHPMAKQMYWLIGENPARDDDYHLLQPLFPSSLVQAVHLNIQDMRFGECNKLACEAYRDKKPHEAPYCSYLDLVERHLGAPPKPTNKQKHLNISHLNAERLGRNYLLASLPPRWKQNRFRNLLNIDSALDRFAHFAGVRQLLTTLADLLRPDPAGNVQTKKKREAIEQALGQQLPVFAASVQAGSEPGWSREPDCHLPLCEQLWLDPERAELPPREGHEQEDADFRAAYERGDWQDEVAGRFANWVNTQLRAAGLTTVGDNEFRHWARQAIVDAAWPVPLQRGTPTGGAA